MRNTPHTPSLTRVDDLDGRRCMRTPTLVPAFLVFAVCLSLALIPSNSHSAAVGGARDIGPILDEVSSDRILTTIDSLSSYWTRRVGQPGNLWSADYLVRCVDDLGYEAASFDSFWCENTGAVEHNVVFRKEGTASLEGYVVVCGHFDSTVGPWDPEGRSPGADDNASGVAGVLEIARVVRDLPLHRDVVFVCFNAEEVGLVGSQHFVDELVAAGDSLHVCLNLDCIAYTDGSWMVTIEDHPDYRSLTRAVAGLVEDYTSITPRLMYDRSSDHWPFVEAGLPAIILWEEPLTPLLHTVDDDIDYLNLDYAEDMTRAYLAALLATAGLEGTSIPIPPETRLDRTCATEALGLPPGALAGFRWHADDFDGAVDGYEYRLLGPSSTDTSFQLVPSTVESVEVELAAEGIHRFQVRAVDDEGLIDITPAEKMLLVGMTYAYPELSIETEVGGLAVFRGGSADASDFPDTLFEGECIRVRWRASSERYCAAIEGYRWCVDDTTLWHPATWSTSDTVLTAELEPGDHVLGVRALDVFGYETRGMLEFHVAQFGGSGPLLLVDDFNHHFVNDGNEDAFFDTLLAGRDWVQWDADDAPGPVAAPPPVALVADAEHVLWSVDNSAPQLATISVGGYSYLEGYVRAGGNLILAGWCPTEALAGFPDYPAAFQPGDFLHDFAWIDSVRNTGGSNSPNPPSNYGFAFLGAHSTGVLDIEGVHVDTAGKWGPYYSTYGGLPYCDAFELAAGGQDLLTFRSYINPQFQDAVCGAVRYGTSGEGSVAVLGFPLYFLQTAGARDMIGGILESFETWKTPAELAAFDWAAEADSVVLSWSVAPDAGVQGFHVWRRDAGGAAYDEVTEAMVEVSPEGDASFTDRSVAGGMSYDYRLLVVERWGGTTAHGPWPLTTPAHLPSKLSLSSVGANPFSDAATLALAVPAPGERIRVDVYDLAGRRVATVCDSHFDPGVHELCWSGRNRSDRRVASGVYFVRASGERAEVTRKLVLIR
jgi:hypothetical protein